MFFILSKMLSFLLNPLVWIMTLLIFALFLKKEKWRKRSLQLCLFCLLFFSNGWISDFVVRQWEPTPLLVKNIQQPYDLAIVLSGYARVGNDLPNESTLLSFSQAGNRLHYAVQLYRMGKVKKLLLSGGSGKLVGKKISESAEVKRYLLNIGIPESDIIVEPTSRNTRENALFTANLFKETKASYQNILLITSASHLPRAKKCFAKVGVSVTPFAVDSTPKFKNLQFNGLIPSLEALNTWKSLLKEWVGIFVYWIRGWV